MPVVANTSDEEVSETKRRSRLCELGVASERGVNVDYKLENPQMSLNININQNPN